MSGEPDGHAYHLIDGRGGMWLSETSDKYPEPSPIALLHDILAELTELAAAREALGRVRELAERRPFFIVDCGAGLFYDSVLVEDLTAALDGPSGGGGV